MAITLTVNNIPFDYPEQGEQQPWGESATAWAKEVTTVLSSIKGAYDVLENSDVINNNVLIPEKISVLYFPTSEVRSFYIQGNVWRYVGSESNPSEQYSEAFFLTGLNTGTSWDIQVETVGDAGIEFTVDNTGQVRYTTNNKAGTVGIVKFRGIGVLKI